MGKKDSRIRFCKCKYIISDSSKITLFCGCWMLQAECYVCTINDSQMLPKSQLEPPSLSFPRSPEPTTCWLSGWLFSGKADTIEGKPQDHPMDDPCKIPQHFWETQLMKLHNFMCLQSRSRKETG